MGEVKKMYQTSHQRDFQNIPGPRSDPLRPRTTEFAAERPYKVDDPLPVTTNGEFHNPKKYSKPNAIRSGTASGTRANNPHPHEMFMTWRIPKGFNAVPAFISSSKSVIRTKNTEIRENFDDKNPLDEPIKENNTRYGCNKLKNTPAI